MIAQPKLSDGETDLVGQWLTTKRKVVGDPTCVRIEWLIAWHLLPLATDESGWDELYRDPETGRLWELTWPQSSMQGGGPPRLTRIETEAARTKYGAIADG